MKKNLKNLICLVLAAAMCLALAACGSQAAPAAAPGASAPAAAKAAASTPAPAYVYAAEFRELAADTDSYITVRSYSDEGFYYSSWEKTGENIPEGVKPEYDGQFDVYETFLYYMDKNGKVTKLENYKTMDAPQSEEGRKNFSSGSDMSGICFTPEGFVTIESTYCSWTEGGDNVVLYSDEYWQSQKYENKFYIRSFDRNGRELSTAPIEVPQDTWLDAYRLQLDDKGNALVSTGQGIRAIGLDGEDAYTIETNGYVDSLLLSLIHI